jgi:O-antigen/teichoic acid export membrane protein
MAEREAGGFNRVFRISRDLRVPGDEGPLHGLPAGLPGLSLNRNFVWTLAGNLIYAGCQWAAVVLLAKLGSSAMVGQFALAVAVAFPITLIANLQLRVLFVTDHRGKYAFEELLGLRLILSGVAILALLLTCAAAGYGAYTTGLVLVVGVAQLVDCISENYYGISQRCERMDRIARSQMLRSVLSLAALAFVVYYTLNLFWGFFATVLVRALVLLLYDAAGSTFALARADRNIFRTSVSHDRLLERIRPRWHLRNQLQMVWVAFPLAIAGLLVSVNGYLPRYILELHLGQRAVGIYTAISYIPSGGFMVATALAYAVFAGLSKLFATGDLAGFKLLLLKTAGVYGGLGIAGFLLSAVAGRQLLTIVYRPEYAEHVGLLRWLMVAGTVQYLTTAMQVGLTAACQFRVQVPLFAGIAAISLIACTFLVRSMGLVGAGAAVLASSVIQLCGSTFLMFRTIAKRASELEATQCPRLRPALEVRH